MYRIGSSYPIYVLAGLSSRIEPTTVQQDIVLVEETIQKVTIPHSNLHSYKSKVPISNHIQISKCRQFLSFCGETYITLIVEYTVGIFQLCIHKFKYSFISPLNCVKQMPIFTNNKQEFLIFLTHYNIIDLFKLLVNNRKN